ncbi:MAG: protein kinase [Phycisphaerales bacterium]|nr:protein kinase [Phycisphaerales bacterium]
MAYASRAAAGDLRGHRIGNYRLGDKIGGGGMGMVYLAIQDSPRRQVAIKVMRQGITSRSSRDRFKHEADLLARLTHPAVAQVYEAGMHLPPDAAGPEQAIPFFAMEHVRGARTLTAYAAAAHLTPRDRVKLFVEVCRGVQHGHEQGVIHRDLKPANILVSDTGQPKIIDYGVALCIDPEEASPRHTETGQIVGTIQYMSPEQLAGPSRKLDVRTDIYSLGVVLYELICRRLPYDVDGRSFMEATRVILNDLPNSPSELIGSIDHDLETIILRALEKDRHGRFQTVQEMIVQCEKYLRGEELDIAPVSKLTRTWRWSVDAATRRWEWATLAIIAVVTVLVGMLISAMLVKHTNVYEWTLTRTLTHASRYGGGVPLGDVEMVTVTPQSKVAEAAEMLGLPKAATAELYTIRPLYGALLKRLAVLPVRPRVVVLDSRFRLERPGYDEYLAEGITALKKPNPAHVPPSVDVICALASCEPDEEGRWTVAEPLLAAGLLPAAASGHGDEGGTPLIHPQVDLFVKNPDASVALPGMALRAYISSLYPGSHLTVEQWTSSSIRASADEPGVSIDSGPGRRRGSVEVHYFSRAYTSERDVEYGIAPDALVGVYQVCVPTEEHLRGHDVDLADALAMSDEQLGKRFGGKLVAIGVRDGNDIVRLADGRAVAGMEVQATAIASLLAGFNVTQRPAIIAGISGVDATLLWSGMGAIIGAMVGLTWSIHLPKRWFVVLLTCAGTVSVTWVSMRYADKFFNPIPIILSLVIAAEMAGWLYRVRLFRREHMPWRFA